MVPDDGVVAVPLNPQPKGNEMAGELAGNLHEQNMSSLGQIGVAAQANFTTVQKVIDYDHIEQKRIVDLTEAVGVREVASKYVPAGPNSGN